MVATAKKSVRRKKEPALREADTTRPIKYPQIEVGPYFGEDAVTAFTAREWLGWEEEPEGSGFGEDFLFLDVAGKKVRCTNDCHNRPFRREHALKIAYTVLNRQWAGPNGTGWKDDPEDPYKKTVNGEHMIIGRSGLTISCQHRLVGLAFAAQMWAGLGKPDKSSYWRKLWSTEPVMDTMVTFGVDESGVTTKTLDNVLARTEDDVFFTDAQYFGKGAPKDRKELCRMLKFAVKFLWARTGATDNPFSPYRTIGETVNWVDRHPKVKAAVQFIWEANLGKKGEPADRIARYLSPSYAAGLLYLMGSSTSDGGSYHNRVKTGDASEKRLDWDNWARACEFWSNLAATDPAFAALRNARRPFAEGDYDGFYFVKKEKGIASTSGGSLDERIAVIIKAWKAWSLRQPLSSAALVLSYDGVEVPPYYRPEMRNDRLPMLSDYPDVGGIDLGDPETAESVRADIEALGDDVGDDDEDGEGEELTEEEIDRRKAEERAHADAEREARAAEEAEREAERKRKAAASRKRPLAPNVRLTGAPTGTVEEELDAAPVGPDAIVEAPAGATNGQPPPDEVPADPRLPGAPKPRRPIARKP